MTQDLKTKLTVEAQERFDNTPPFTDWIGDWEESYKDKVKDFLATEIGNAVEETEKRVREDERVMFGKKVRSFFKEGEMYIDIANRVLGYIDGLLTQPKEENESITNCI